MVLLIFCFHSLSQNINRPKQSLTLKYFFKMCTQITLYAIITVGTSSNYVPFKTQF